MPEGAKLTAGVAHGGVTTIQHFGSAANLNIHLQEQVFGLAFIRRLDKAREA